MADPLATGHHDVHLESFGQLVREGIYDADFDHAPPLKTFVAETLAAVCAGLPAGRPLHVIDCGCGTGVWLGFARDVIDLARGSANAYFGFDLVPEMVGVAREKLADRVPADHLAVGDILDPRSYAFGDPNRRFDLIFAYDVIQQLPTALQWQAVESLAANMADGGAVIIFDHDGQSPFGRKMAAKKFVTRYLGVPLVPRYYCNARYPPLAGFAERAGQRGLRAGIRLGPGERKRALILSR